MPSIIAQAGGFEKKKFIKVKRKTARRPAGEGRKPQTGGLKAGFPGESVPICRKRRRRVSHLMRPVRIPGLKRG